MKTSLPFVLVILVVRSSVAPAMQVPEQFRTEDVTHGDTDSVAVYAPGDPAQSLLFLTDKTRHRVQMFAGDTDTAESPFLGEFGGQGAGLGQLDRPNGVAVAYGIQVGGGRKDLLVVVERDNKRVQLFELPSLNPLSSFGTVELRRPYGCAVSVEGLGIFLYVTDVSGAKGEKVLKYELGDFDLDGVPDGRHLFSFGDLSDDIETIVADPLYGRVFVCDERDKAVHVFDLSGKFQTKIGSAGSGPGQFEGDPEGAILYQSGAGGALVVTDQTPDVRFNVWDRVTLAVLGDFKCSPALGGTDGITMTQRPLRPHSEGLLYAVHNDSHVRAYDLGEALGQVGVSTHVEHLASDRAAVSIATGGRVEFTLLGEPFRAGRVARLLVNYTGTEPGMSLPLTHLPLNWDSVLLYSLLHPQSLQLQDFVGTLDSGGVHRAAFQIDPGDLPPVAVGLTLNLAYLVFSPPDFASNPVAVEVLQ